MPTVAKLALVRATRRRRGRPSKPLRPRAPRGREAAYRGQLVGLAIEAEKVIRAELFPELKGLTLRSADLRQDSPATDLAAIMDRIEQLMGLTFSRSRARRIAERMVGTVNAWNVAELDRQLSRVLGLGVASVAAPAVGDAMILNVRTNVALITSIGSQLLTQVEEIVARGIRTGVRHEVVAQELRARFGVTRRRAQFIARDQIASINGALTRIRHQGLGITHFRWITSRDGAVRDLHEEADGQIYKYGQGPDPDGDPGEPPGCRCTASPILPNQLI